MKPSHYFIQMLSLDSGTPHTNQLAILSNLDELSTQINQRHKQNKTLLGRLKRKPLIQGYYLWGSVGIGKTLLMDSLYQSIETNAKWRIHFHEFMKYIHDQLKVFSGKSDPVIHIANKISQQYTLLCFDEFVVHDIADAIILGKLFMALIKANTIIIATSNVHPDDLYKDGLQRNQFLPAIACIKENLNIHHLITDEDYRYHHATEMQAHSVQLESRLTQLFDVIAIGEKEPEPILLYDRLIPVIRHSQNAIWFHFDVICNIPRSAHDYLALTHQYTDFFVSGLKVLTAKDNNQTRLFIHFIDILYDKHCRLHCELPSEIQSLYTGEKLAFEFKRTASRLTEIIAYSKRSHTLSK